MNLIVGALMCLLPITANAAPKRPRLVVLISIDQFRGDYIRRFNSQFLPPTSKGKLGGFRYLMETGADFADAHHNHIPTETGPGHATLMTGSEPCLDGIPGNEWFDRLTKKSIYCVDDANVSVVGGGPTSPMSPRNLKVTTVGDELKMATNGKAKVVGVSFKDRAAILMAGHAANTVIWFDAAQGTWISSSFYCPSKQLPTWVQKLNDEHIPDKATGQTWTPLLPGAAYDVSRVSPTLKPSSTTLPFEHKVTKRDGKSAYSDFTLSRFGQEFVIQSAERAIKEEGLGQDDIPDVLVINLATNDYLGHAFGPNSPEVQDITIRTDSLLADLFNSIQKQVPGGMDSVVVTLTGDHGVVPIPEDVNQNEKTGAARQSSSAVAKAIDNALSLEYGPGKYVLDFEKPNVYLDRTLISSKNIRQEDAQRIAVAAAAEVPGVYVAFTRAQIMEGRLPQWSWTPLIVNGFHPSLSGDLMVFENPGDYFGSGTGTGHGSPWFYDSHVPILMRGPGITPGTYTRKVATADIAPTLSYLLGIEPPTGCLGTILKEALEKK